jgi:RNA polymerase sigma factor (sigma-70 family)
VADEASQLRERIEHQLIVAGDQERFAHWLARCEEPLRLSLRNFARVVDVEAVVQETALRVWQSAARIEPDGRPGFLLRWAITVARNLARDTARRAGREVALDEGYDAPAPSSTAPGDPILNSRIRVCREQLPPKPAAAIEARLSFGGTVSDRQLAERIEMTFDAFRQNLSRARHLLEQCLERAGIDVRSLLS